MSVGLTFICKVALSQSFQGVKRWHRQQILLHSLLQDVVSKATLATIYQRRCKSRYSSQCKCKSASWRRFQCATEESKCASVNYASLPVCSWTHTHNTQCASVNYASWASVQVNKAEVTSCNSGAAPENSPPSIPILHFNFCIFYVLAFAFLLSCTRKFRHLSDGNEVGLNDTRGQLDCRGMAFALPRLCKTFLCWHSSFAKGSLPLFDPLCFWDTDARLALQVNQSKSEGKAWSSFCLSHFHVKLCFSPISCAWSGQLHGGL